MNDSTAAPGDPRSDARAAADRARDRLSRVLWPPPLLETLDRLRAGEGQAYLVGGTVRDALLDRLAPPYDVATDRTPDEVTARFERVEPIGIRHGTVLVVVEGVLVECTTFRREGDYVDARRPDRVTFTRDPREDLDRRDLTVNALLYDPATGRLMDPHGGALDLERGVLRAVGDPRLRFREDALRPVRVARLAATLGMAPDPATRAALGAERERARRLARERVRDEFVRMLTAPRPSVGFELLREAGLLDLWLPELARCHGVPQNRHHAYDVYEHSLRSCDAARGDRPVVRWAALLHDVGKPDTRVERSGEGTFHNHQIVGAELADAALERLRFPVAERRAIVHLIREHMFAFGPEWSDAALRRWLRRVGADAVEDLVDLRVADNAGRGVGGGLPSHLDELRRRIERLTRESHALRVADLAVDGHDVMRVLGLPPGPRVGEVLEALLEEVLDHPERNRREVLLEGLARRRPERSRGGRSAP